MAVGRLHLGPHPAQRRRDALHRPRRQRLVAGERELAVLPGEDAGTEAHERARVAAVDRAGPQAAQADAPDDEVVVGDVLDLGAERAHRVDRRLRVARAAEAVHARLPLAERADQDGAVRDRLVPGHDDVPDERSSGLYAHVSRSCAP